MLLFEAGAGVSHCVIGPIIFGSVLMFACRSGDLEAVKLIVTSGADLNQACKEGYTAWHCSISKHASSLAIFNYLLDAGHDIKVSDKIGNSNLHTAGMSCHFEIY